MIARILMGGSMVTINTAHHVRLNAESERTGIDSKALFDLYIKKADQYYNRDKRPIYQKIGAIVWNEYYERSMNTVSAYCDKICRLKDQYRKGK